MGILFYGKDILHKIAVKFAPSFLPDTKKPFYLKTARQKVLDVHGIAARAARYDMSLPPEVIENVLNASFELIAYLIADGFKIKTPLFTIRVRVPGEYDGTETRLPAGVYPEARIQVSADLREYLKKRAEIVLDGFDESGELIAEAIDEASGLSGRIMTMGNILTIYGSGLKVDADSAKKAEAGVFFENEAGERIKTPAIAVNEPRTLKVLIPLTLESGAPYRIVIHTQTPARGHGSLLKNIRQVRSEFTLKAERG